MKSRIATNNAPQAIGPYSQGIVVTGGELIFTAGQIPLDPASGELQNETIQQATIRVLENLQSVLQAAGSDLSHAVKITVYMTDLGDFAAMNEVYGRYFKSNPPARSAVQVAALPKGARIEMDAIALKPS